MKTLLIAIGFIFFMSNSSLAASSSKENLLITPIVGFERIQKVVPTPTMKTRTVLGARAVYQLNILSAELEYTHGQDTSSDLTTSTNYKDEEDKVKLGLRGNMALGQFVSTYLRGGAQGRQNKQTKTVGGVSTVTTSKVKVNPYIGTGLSIHLLQYFSLDADIVAVYTPTSDGRLKDYEYQPSLGFSLKF